MERKTKVAVVGVGFFGERHAKIYSELQNVQLAAVVDSDLARAREVAKRYGPRCEAYPDISFLLGKIDAASIATPTAYHAPVALSLLDAGVHLLIEKPITRTLEEADAIRIKAEQTGKIVHVGHIERYNPALLKLRKYPLAPRVMECQRMGPFVERAANVSVVLDLMIHDIDIVLSLAKAQITDVYATGISVVSPYTDIAHARLLFADGAVAHIMASRVAEAPFRTLQIWGDQTYFVVNYLARELTVFSSETGQKKYSFEQGNPLKAEISAFIEAVSNDVSPTRGMAPSFTGASGLMAREAVAVALRIMEAIKA